MEPQLGSALEQVESAVEIKTVPLPAATCPHAVCNACKDTDPAGASVHEAASKVLLFRLAVTLASGVKTSMAKRGVLTTTGLPFRDTTTPPSILIGWDRWTTANVSPTKAAKAKMSKMPTANTTFL